MSAIFKKTSVENFTLFVFFSFEGFPNSLIYDYSQVSHTLHDISEDHSLSQLLVTARGLLNESVKDEDVHNQLFY